MQERLKLTERGREDLITNGFSFLVSYCFPPLVITPCCFLGFNPTGGLLTEGGA